MQKRRGGRIQRGRRPQREHRINTDIKEVKVRLIADDSSVLLSTNEALRRAKEADLDLVEIAKGQEIPIVKIIDYGKFKFEKSKKDKELKKKQKVTHVKEVKMGPKIDVGDFDRKCALAKEFLENGDTVKVSMRFRGREMAHTELGLEKMQQFAKNLEDIAGIDRNPMLEGRMMTMMLRPKSKKGGKEKEVNSKDA